MAARSAARTIPAWTPTEGVPLTTDAASAAAAADAALTVTGLQTGGTRSARSHPQPRALAGTLTGPTRSTPPTTRFRRSQPRRPRPPKPRRPRPVTSREPGTSTLGSWYLPLSERHNALRPREFWWSHTPPTHPGGPPFCTPPATLVAIASDHLAYLVVLSMLNTNPTPQAITSPSCTLTSGRVPSHGPAPAHTATLLPGLHHPAPILISMTVTSSPPPNRQVDLDSTSH